MGSSRATQAPPASWVAGGQSAGTVAGHHMTVQQPGALVGPCLFSCSSSSPDSRTSCSRCTTSAMLHRAHEWAARHDMLSQHGCSCRRQASEQAVRSGAEAGTGFNPCCTHFPQAAPGADVGAARQAVGDKLAQALRQLRVDGHAIARRHLRGWSMGGCAGQLGREARGHCRYACRCCQPAAPCTPQLACRLC